MVILPPSPTHFTNPSAAVLLQEFVLDPARRRKLSVHVEGNRTNAAGEGAGAAAAADVAPAAEEGTGGDNTGAPAGGGPQAAGAAGEGAKAAAAAATGQSGGEAPAVERIDAADIYSWKRRQQLWGTFK